MARTIDDLQPPANEKARELLTDIFQREQFLSDAAETYLAALRWHDMHSGDRADVA